MKILYILAIMLSIFFSGCGEEYSGKAPSVDMSQESVESDDSALIMDAPPSVPSVNVKN